MNVLYAPSDYASFFKDLTVSKEGILPLEAKPMMVKPDYRVFGRGHI